MDDLLGNNPDASAYGTRHVISAPGAGSVYAVAHKATSGIRCLEAVGLGAPLLARGGPLTSPVACSIRDNPELAPYSLVRPKWRIWGATESGCGLCCRDLFRIRNTGTACMCTCHTHAHTAPHMHAHVHTPHHIHACVHTYHTCTHITRAHATTHMHTPHHTHMCICHLRHAHPCTCHHTHTHHTHVHTTSHACVHTHHMCTHMHTPHHNAHPCTCHHMHAHTPSHT